MPEPIASAGASGKREAGASKGKSLLDGFRQRGAARKAEAGAVSGKTPGERAVKAIGHLLKEGKISGYGFNSAGQMVLHGVDDENAKKISDFFKTHKIDVFTPTHDGVNTWMTLAPGKLRKKIRLLALQPWRKEWRDKYIRGKHVHPWYEEGAWYGYVISHYGGGGDPRQGGGGEMQPVETRPGGRETSPETGDGRGSGTPDSRANGGGRGQDSGPSRTTGNPLSLLRQFFDGGHVTGVEHKLGMYENHLEVSASSRESLDAVREAIEPHGLSHGFRVMNVRDGEGFKLRIVPVDRRSADWESFTSQAAQLVRSGKR